jgi:hypothetical protein
MKRRTAEGRVGQGQERVEPPWKEARSGREREEEREVVVEEAMMMMTIWCE